MKYTGAIIDAIITNEMTVTLLVVSSDLNLLEYITWYTTVNVLSYLNNNGYVVLLTIHSTYEQVHIICSNRYFLYLLQWVLLIS